MLPPLLHFTFMNFSAINKPNSKAVQQPHGGPFAQHAGSAGWTSGGMGEGPPRKARAGSASRSLALLPAPAAQSLARHLRPSRLSARPAARCPLPYLQPTEVRSSGWAAGWEAVLPRPACPGGAAFGFLP